MRMQLRNVVVGMVLFLVPSLAAAQDGTITGQVIDDQTGVDLPGANILVEELGIGAATDANGIYEIEDVPPGSYTVRASFIGYLMDTQAVTVQAGETVTVNLALEPDYAGLEEVVVTGIASSTSKARAAIAVSRVNAEELTTLNTYQDFSQLIGAKVAGLSVLPASGNVGGGVRFNVRGGGGLNGQGQPIIYIDGVRISNNEIVGFGAGGQGTSQLADLNPEDIASVDILKGPASTAVYGTEGANGVVLITTKRGRLQQGGGINVRYKGSFGYNTQLREYSESDYVTASDANAIFRDGDIRQHTLSVSGGSEHVTYFASFDNRFEQGIIPNNEGDRTSFRANFNAFPSEKVTLKASAAYTLNEMMRPDNDNNIFGFLGNTLLFSVPYAFTDSLSVNAIDDRRRINRFLGSAEATYAPIRNLEFAATVGFDGSNLRQDRTFPQDRSYSGVVNGERNFYGYGSERWNGHVSARYNYTIVSGLTATSILGGQFLDSKVRTAFGTAQDFSTSLITNMGAGNDLQLLDEGYTNERQGGLYGQQELSYLDTYFLSFILRRDFASAIGVEAPSIMYPNIRGAIRFDQFAFTPDLFELLKLRAAYGEAGNLPGLLDVQRLRYGAKSSGFGAGATIDEVGNPELVPERVREFEVGLDMEMFNRFSVEGTYFRTFTDDSIIDFVPAPSTGFGNQDLERNVGQITAKGFELALGVTPYRSRDSQIDINATYAYQTSEVKDLGGSPPIFDGFDLNVIEEGLPRSAFYTSEVSGAAFNDEGVYTGPELVEDGERQLLGIPFPEHFGGISLNVRLFGGLSVYALADYALGHSVFNSTNAFAASFGNHPEFNRLATQLGIAGSGVAAFAAPVEGVEELDPGTEGYRQAANDFALLDHRFDGNYVEEADYIKLREVTVMYDVSDLIRRYTGTGTVRHLSVGLSARNVLTSTKYSNPDPEVNFSGSRSLTRGQDFLTLQNPRSLYFTVSMGL